MSELFNMSNTSNPIVRDYARVPETVSITERHFILLYAAYAQDLSERGYKVLTAADFMVAMKITIV